MRRRPRTLGLCLVLLGGCYTGAEADVIDPTLSGPADGPGVGDPDDDGDDGDDTGPPDSSDVEASTRSRIWRLTWEQYDSAVSDLLRVTVTPSAALERPLLINPVYGYLNEADSLAISVATMRQLGAAAEEAAAVAVGQLDTLLPCAAPDPADPACVAAFVDDLGSRAFRRPLTAEERERYLDLHADAAAAFDPPTAVGLIVEAILLSPHFLYRFELGSPSEDGRTRLDAHELAAALALTLWNRPPDARLRELAASETILDPQVLEGEVRRLVAAPEGHAVLLTFVPQWLHYFDADALEKDPTAFPDFDAVTAAELDGGAARFVAEIVDRHGASLHALLTEPVAFAPDTSAWIFEGEATPASEADAEGYRRWDLDPSKRAGILMQPAFLASHATSVDSSFVSRGLILAERLTCFTPPAPPDDLPQLPPANDELRTARERFEYRTKDDPACSGCHVTFTPLGFALENFDAVGRHRTLDNGGVVDPSGTTPLLPSLDDGDFDGAVDLVAMLAESEEVPACVARQMFRYVYGRMEESDADEATIERAAESFGANGLDLRELLVALIVDENFTLRVPGS
jgi:hypothetical protein